MIDSACLHGDRENGQSIARGGGFLGFCVAIRPDDGGNSRCPVYPDRVALNGLREFAIDVDNAVWPVGWRGIGCPTAAIIRGQLRRRRSIKLAEYDGERGNWHARNSLCRVAAAGHYDHCQREKQENTHAFCQQEKRCFISTRLRLHICKMTFIYLILLMLCAIME